MTGFVFFGGGTMVVPLVNDLTSSRIVNGTSENVEQMLLSSSQLSSSFPAADALRFSPKAGACLAGETAAEEAMGEKLMNGGSEKTGDFV